MTERNRTAEQAPGADPAYGSGMTHCRLRDDALSMVIQDLRVIGAFIDRADQLDVLPIEEGASALQALVNVQHFLGTAREALAGLGSGQGPVAGSEAAQDTPADSQEDKT